jgi:hypothetical protein
VTGEPQTGEGGSDGLLHMEVAPGEDERWVLHTLTGSLLLWLLLVLGLCILLHLCLLLTGLFLVLHCLEAFFLVWRPLCMCTIVAV